MAHWLREGGGALGKATCTALCFCCGVKFNGVCTVTARECLPAVETQEKGFGLKV